MINPPRLRDSEVVLAVTQLLLPTVAAFALVDAGRRPNAPISAFAGYIRIDGVRLPLGAAVAVVGRAFPESLAYETNAVIHRRLDGSPSILVTDLRHRVSNPLGLRTVVARVCRGAGLLLFAFTEHSAVDAGVLPVAPNECALIDPPLLGYGKVVFAMA